MLVDQFHHAAFKYRLFVDFVLYLHTIYSKMVIIYLELVMILLYSMSYFLQYTVCLYLKCWQHIWFLAATSCYSHT